MNGSVSCVWGRCPLEVMDWLHSIWMDEWLEVKWLWLSCPLQMRERRNQLCKLYQKPWALSPSKFSTEPYLMLGHLSAYRETRYIFWQELLRSCLTLNWGVAPSSEQQKSEMSIPTTASLRWSALRVRNAELKPVSRCQRANTLSTQASVLHYHA